MHPRTALLTLVGGLAFRLWWYWEIGMSLWLTALYPLLAMAVAYARIRAEAGMPLIWMFPWYQHKKFIVNLLGSKRLVHEGDLPDPPFCFSVGEGKSVDIDWLKFCQRP